MVRRSFQVSLLCLMMVGTADACGTCPFGWRAAQSSRIELPGPPQLVGGLLGMVAQRQQQLKVDAGIAVGRLLFDVRGEFAHEELRRR